ncbi:MAG: multidrug effflux MFS transporter [Pseudomonadota bacterium]
MFLAATTPPRMATLVCLTGLSLLSLNIYLPSLAHMAEALEVDYAVVNASISGYLILTGVLQLIIGPLSDRYGRRPLILIGSAVFAVASVGCALSTDIVWFLAFRALQGAVISGSALSRAVVRDLYPAQEAASRLGYLSMAMALAPLLGPALGGALDAWISWRASFWCLAIIGGLLFAICWTDLGETNKTPSATFADQFRDYPELFGSRRFWGYAFCMMFSTGVFFIFIGGAPLVAATHFNLTPGEIGIYLGATPLGFLAGSAVSGRYASRLPLITMILIGRSTTVVGVSAGLLLMTSGIVSAEVMFGSAVFVGIGNGLSMPSTTAGALSVRPRLAGSASGLAGAMLVGGGGVLNWLSGAIQSEVPSVLALFGLMVTASVLALAAALYVQYVNRLEAQATVAD